MIDLESIQALSLLSFLGKQLWYSSILFCVVFALTLLMGSRLPRLQYGLWALVLIRLLIPVDLASSWSARSLLENLPRDDFSFMDTGDYGYELPSGSLTRSPVLERFSWELGMVPLWLIGVSFCAYSFEKRRRRCRREVACSMAVRDEQILVLARRWQNRFRIRRTVEVVSSSSRLSPFTLGLIRPVVFIPSRLLERGDASLVEAALAHEMAHIRRWDDLHILAQNVVRSLYFFHPPAWLAVQRMSEERERICDEMVLADGNLPAKDYARGLLEVLRIGLDTPSQAPALLKDGRRLSLRLERIVSGKTDNGKARAFSCFIIVVVGLLLLPMAQHSGSASIMVRGTGFSSLAPLADDWVSPVLGGRLSSVFGERRNPITGVVEDHPGVDLAARTGAGVVASAGGVVEITDEPYRERRGLGKVVVIDHGDGRKTLYAHLKSIGVRVGARVSRGETIGQVGSTGVATGPHLHFELWEQGQPIDPSLFVEGGSR